MDPNNSKNTIEDDFLDESDISSNSSAGGMDMKKMAEKIHKLEAELNQNNEVNLNEFGGPLMMQMSLQIGKKFGELKEEINGLNAANRMEIQTSEELKTEMAKMKQAFEGLEAKNKNLEENVRKEAEEKVVLKEKLAKVEAGLGGFKEEFEGLKMQNEDLKKRIEKCSKENSEIKEKIRGMKLAAEIAKDQEKLKMDELKLANLNERIEGMEFIKLDKNKWNAADCGPELAISERALVVKHNGPEGFNCIHAILPIPYLNLNAEKEPSIAVYFEAQIISKNPTWDDDIDIGFCTKQFPHEGKWLGNGENSIGIYCKTGMVINGQFNEFANNAIAEKYFEVGDVIGAGIIHFPANSLMKCFATWNGDLLGIVELPTKFAHLQMFPSVCLFDKEDSIRANFGRQEWRYYPSSQLFKYNSD